MYTNAHIYLHQKIYKLVDFIINNYFATIKMMIVLFACSKQNIFIFYQCKTNTSVHVSRVDNVNNMENHFHNLKFYLENNVFRLIMKYDVEEPTQRTSAIL